MWKVGTAALCAEKAAFLPSVENAPKVPWLRGESYERPNKLIESYSLKAAMRVESTAEIAGLPVLEVRRLLRETMHDYSWYKHTLKAVLKVSDRRCAAVLRSLAKEGYIEASPSFRGAWRNTTKGNALASASAAKSLRRETADQKLRELLDRVHFVNSPACDFLYWVEEVALFGSMLKQQQSVNDIDVCVRMERKLDGEAFSKAADSRSRMAREQGRSFRNIVDEVYWPEREVRLFLKNRSRAISLVEWDVKWLAVTPHKIIYRRLASAQPPKKTDNNKNVSRGAGKASAPKVP